MTPSATEQARLGELDGVLADQSIDQATPAELFAFVDALDSQSALKRALTDPATPAEARQQVAERLLQGKVGGQTIWIVTRAVGLRWNSGRALADGLERQGVRSLLVQARDGGYLDEVNSQLYSFQQLLEGNGELADALSDGRRPLQARQELVARLLDGRAHGWVRDLVQRAVAGRERNVGLTLQHYLDLAAQLRDRDVAKVTVARPMTPDQEQRMAAALGRINGRQVDLQVTVDPSVIGGVRVELGDEVYEGTVSDRLEQVHRHLA